MSPREEAIDPGTPIVDPHYHLLPDGPNSVVHVGFGKDEFLADLDAGHQVLATVYLECGARYRTEGPELLRPVGETEMFAALSGGTPQMSAMVAYADVSLGARIGELLDAHQATGGDTVKGVRRPYAWDPSPDVPNTARDPGRVDALLDPEVVAGLEEVAARDMVFESALYFHQLPYLAEAARRMPELPVVVDHLGGPLAVGAYAKDRPAMLREWRTSVETIASCPNVVMKIGGIGYTPYVEDLVRSSPLSSEWLAEYWAPEVRFLVETFGSERCMFESNFPMDRDLVDYVTLWNVFKRLGAEFTGAQRADLFRATATRVYRL